MFLTGCYAPDIWKSLQWAEQRAIEKSNRTRAKAAVQYTLTLSLCNSWNESIETSLHFILVLVFQFPFLHVQIYIAQYSIKYCHWIDWWPVLKLDFREFNQPSEDHQIKVTFLLSVLTFSRRFTYRILLMTFFENVSEI